ncbi:MAG: tail fiber domain-containing protein [Bacteroidota bacterium]
MKIKSNIRNINSSLEKIKKLRPVKYDVNFELDENLPESRKELIIKESKNKVGFIAQEMKEVIPEVVGFDDDAKLYAIDYASIVPFLVEAIKEQQMIIESIQSEITELKNQAKDNTDKLKISKISTDPDKTQGDNKNTLYQNSPNPFKESTKIEYFLSDDVSNAMINIYDMNGTQLKSIDLYEKGYGNITVNGSEFNAGIYIYAFIADGQVIDTKQMILTD